jgi:hypothetical protein
MSDIHDLRRYKEATQKLPHYEAHFRKLDEFSNYLFNNLLFPGTFDIIKVVESEKIRYYIEINELKRVINDKAIQSRIRLKLIKIEGTDEKS